ncbi:MAG: hypothetical protein WCX31_11500 [Salinivirgaceae bacterium]
MKKLVVLLVAITLGLTTAVSARELRYVDQKLPVEFKKAISKHLHYPEYAKMNNIEGEVWMQVTIDENCNVLIVDLSATNPELGSYVIKELSELCVKNSKIQAGDVYMLKVKFDIL